MAKITFDDVRRIGLALDGAEESMSYGTPAIKLRGKPFVRLKEDGASIVLWTTFEERERLVNEAPSVFFWTDHYERYPMVLARLDAITNASLKTRVTASYAVIDAATAKKKTVRARGSAAQRSSRPRRRA
jgi:hypothetical protein